ncbi:RING-variant domain-containing protein [Pisolithus marmoratus]|nr:RING-variant domain-containing protein [Pisolithus marmoratus]
MQEAEELDTCRICSAPGEPGQPLFHPCKCSGTIRYIHQDCLTTWLSHSKKKTCDVCKHPYAFRKVYAPDMPEKLPPLLLVRRLAQQALFGVLFGLRAILITIVWLAVLPWITIWTWRLYFTMGESTAWWISGRDQQLSSSSAGLVSLAATNETASLLSNSTALHRLMSRPFWQSLSADIFAGQIIASLIVLTFVAVFLLREWISQNARPGVFEEEDLGVPLMNAPVLEPVIRDVVELEGRFNPVAPFPIGRDFAAGREEARRQARFMRARRGGVAQNGQLERLPRRPNNVEREPPPLPSPSLLQIPDNNEPPAPTGKGKARLQEDFDDDGFTGLRRRTRRRLDSQDQRWC